MSTSSTSRKSFEARILDKIAHADESENGCLTLSNSSHNTTMTYKKTCPLNCENVIKSNEKLVTGRHKGFARTCLMIKVLELLDLPGGAEKALALVTQRDQEGRPYDVSHLCRVRRDQLCIESTHFEMETREDNTRRTVHQNGNAVCSCETFGLKPCRTNGSIGEMVYDDNGVHVGWKKAVHKSKRARA